MHHRAGLETAGSSAPGEPTESELRREGSHASGRAVTPRPPDSRARELSRVALLVLLAAARVRVVPARRKCGTGERRRGKRRSRQRRRARSSLGGARCQPTVGGGSGSSRVRRGVFSAPGALAYESERRTRPSGQANTHCPG